MRILIYIIKILVNLSQYQETVGTFNNCYLIRFRNNYRHFKYYLSNIDITFGVMLFSCIILITISILFLSLTFGFFVSNTIKIFLFTRFRKIKGVLVFCFHIFVSFFSGKLLLSGGTETNPGPRIHSNNHFTICHWNLNKIFVHNFAKVQLLKAHLAVHKFDMVCLSKTYLNSSFPFDDDNLDIPSYIMARADHTVNCKRGGVCKNCLSSQVFDSDFFTSFWVTNW